MSIRLLPVLPLLLAAAPALAADDGGKPSLELRYRYEHVEQDGVARNANAHTARLRLGYRTARWHGWSALAEADGVAHLGGERFNDTRNGRTGYPTVADPDYAELNQALLRYDGAHANVQFGRQRINLGNQRFVGGVGWRQNEQTYDGVRLQASPWKPLQLDYAWIGGINTVFGPGDGEASTPANRSDIDGDSHLLQATWTPLPALTATAYHYRLELENVAVTATAPLGTLSSRTSGLRLAGSHGGVSYAAEYARQRELDGNPWRLDSRYALAELGYSVRGASFKAGWESLGGGGGPGNRAFQTPLATKHGLKSLVR